MIHKLFFVVIAFFLVTALFGCSPAEVEIESIVKVTVIPQPQDWDPAIEHTLTWIRVNPPPGVDATCYAYFLASNSAAIYSRIGFSGVYCLDETQNRGALTTPTPIPE